MKYLAIFALLAVASASVIPPTVKAENVQVGPAIVDNYEPISIGPAIVDNYEPISVGPAIVDNYEPISIGPAIVDNYEPISVGPAIVDNYEPISIGPAIIDFPVPDGGAVTAVEPSPAMPAPADSSAAPLVQIILNINKAALNMPGSPVVVEGLPSAPPAPTPVQVVDAAEGSESINVVDMPAILPEPVIVAEPSYLPEPVIVVEDAAVPETVQVAQPIIPVPAIVVPEILN